VGLRETISAAFSFGKSRKLELGAEHLITEHHKGRSLDEIMKDSYIVNLLSPSQIPQLLERPDVLHAFGDDLVAQQRAAASLEA
jgi:hypothetical protein